MSYKRICACAFCCEPGDCDLGAGNWRSFPGGRGVSWQCRWCRRGDCLGLRSCVISWYKGKEVGDVCLCELERGDDGGKSFRGKGECVRA